MHINLIRIVLFCRVLKQDVTEFTSLGNPDVSVCDFTINYRISIKFGGELNLANWRFVTNPPNLNFVNIYISNPKQPSCKKSVWPSERLWWKKMWNPRWRPRNGCDGRLMVKILITTIQVNFCAASQNLPKLSLLKFLPLTYHHSHFLAATLDFTSFFTIAFLRAAHFFYSLAVLD